MVVLRRWALIGGALVLMVLCLIFVGKTEIKYFSEPLNVVLVLGLTLLIGFLTYDPKQLSRVLRGMFSRRAVPNRSSYRHMLGQLALYALVSGILLTVVQILMFLGQIKSVVPKGENLHGLRMPLMTLLYGVLTAIGLWVAAGLDKPEEGQKKFTSRDKNQVIVAFSVMLLAVGVLSVLIIGVNQIVSSSAYERIDLPVEFVPGLRRGDDMVWRPVTVEQKTDSSSPGLLPSSEERTPFTLRKMDNRTGMARRRVSEIPLRWELDINTNQNTMPKSLTVPLVKQN